MKYLLNWIKANPVTVLSAVVVVISLGVLGWAWLEGRQFRAELSDRSNQIGTVDRLRQTSVNIPSEQPDAPADEVSNVTVTAGAVDRLRHLFERMTDEYDEVFSYAISFNSRHHEPIHDEVFPDAPTSAARLEARENYRDAFRNMFREYDPDASGPRLNASAPPYADQITEQLEAFEEQYMATVRPGGGRRDLTDQEERELRTEMRAFLAEYLQSVASQMHVYADTDADIDSERFPFYVAPWSATGETPTMAQLWEGQLELWIQQDIARAIAQVNNADDPGASVVDGVVKRIVRLDVVPGYVGLHTLGGVPTELREQSRRDRTQRGGSEQRRDGTYPPPADGRTGEPDQPTPDNFYVGPTGRVSNALYDVRHARLVAVVDYHRLPALIDALADVNFMTVLTTDFRKVNEYEAMREGYFYGEGDAVEVDMVIETIWIRDWTRELMPSLTREYLGIEEVSELQDDVESGWDDPMMDDPMMYEDPMMNGGRW